MAQTTFNNEEYVKIANRISESSKNSIIFDTICMATNQRQENARKLSAKSDTFFVIGDKKSANSNRLYEIAKNISPNTYFIQSSDDIKAEMLKGKNIGITAGASTPENVINEVVNKINKM